jgi:adenylosuccinate lyase
MDNYIPLSKRAISELRNRAAEYRRIAKTARTLATVAQLIRLADRFDALANTREAEMAAER